MVFELEGLSCGYDFGEPVLEDVYKSPFTFTGTLHSVTIDVSGDLIEDDEATLRRMMAQQEAVDRDSPLRQAKSGAGSRFSSSALRFSALRKRMRVSAPRGTVRNE